MAEAVLKNEQTKHKAKWVPISKTFMAKGFGKIVLGVTGLGLIGIGVAGASDPLYVAVKGLPLLFLPFGWWFSIPAYTTTVALSATSPELCQLLLATSSYFPIRYGLYNEAKQIKNGIFYKKFLQARLDDLKTIKKSLE